MFSILLGLFPLFQSFFMFSYITTSNSFPKPLTPEEEEKRLIEFQNGSIEAKNILIEHNLRLVAHIVKKYPNFSKDSEDFISIGTIGLIKAIMTFKPGKGTKLATYASRCIENEILMTIRSGKKHQNDIYLQDSIGTDKDGNEVSLQDKVPDDSCDIEEETALNLKVQVLMKKMAYVLTERERYIIELRYGLKTGEEVTQREIAKMLNISRSYVSRIEKKALKKLFTAMEDWKEE